MGKSTISTGPFSIAMWQITRGYRLFFRIYKIIDTSHVFLLLSHLRKCFVSLFLDEKKTRDLRWLRGFCSKQEWITELQPIRNRGWDSSNRLDRDIRQICGCLDCLGVISWGPCMVLKCVLQVGMCSKWWESRPFRCMPKPRFAS